MSGGAIVLLIVLGALVAIPLLIAAMVYLVVPAAKGVYWVFAQVVRFLVSTIVDILKFFGAIITAIVLIPLTVVNVAIGRWSAAGHFGRSIQGEFRGMGGCLYRLVVGNPARLLCLTPLTEGLEKRIPEAIAAAPGADKPGKRTGAFDGYKIVGSLAGGGSGGKLYIAEPDPAKRAALARQGITDIDKVVIKCFSLSDGSSLPQIVRENRALPAAKRLGLILEHELTEDRFHYVMKYVPGESLGAATQRLHSASGSAGLGDRQLRDVITYAQDLLRTLEHYHRGGLWHKDVKPDNIIVSANRACLVDFGLVTPLRSSMTLTTHGTEYFRDPEMVRMALRGVKVHEVDGARFDLYATGAVIYSMVENSFPAHGGLSQISKRCPEALKWVVRRAMTDYDKRYATSSDMLADLDAIAMSSEPFAMKPMALPSVRNGGVNGRMDVPDAEMGFGGDDGAASAQVGIPPGPIATPTDRAWLSKQLTAMFARPEGATDQQLEELYKSQGRTYSAHTLSGILREQRYKYGYNVQPCEDGAFRIIGGGQFAAEAKQNPPYLSAFGTSVAAAPGAFASMFGSVGGMVDAAVAKARNGDGVFRVDVAEALRRKAAHEQAAAASSKRPSMRVTSWWSGRYSVNDESPSHAPNAPAGFGAAGPTVVAAAWNEGQRMDASPVAEVVGGVIGAKARTPGLTAAEQLAKARGRARDARKRAQERLKSRINEGGPGVNLGVGLAALVFIGLCVVVGGGIVVSSLDASRRGNIAHEQVREQMTIDEPERAASSGFTVRITDVNGKSAANPSASRSASDRRSSRSNRERTATPAPAWVPAEPQKVVVLRDPISHEPKHKAGVDAQVARLGKDGAFELAGDITAVLAAGQTGLARTEEDFFELASAASPVTDENSELVADLRSRIGVVPMDCEQSADVIRAWLNEHDEYAMVVWIGRNDGADPVTWIVGSEGVEEQVVREAGLRLRGEKR